MGKVSSSNSQGVRVPKLRFPGFEGEWNRVLFSDLFAYLSNNTLSRAELSNSGKVRNIHYGDVLIKYGEVIVIEHTEIPYVADVSRLRKPDYLSTGDVVIADTAEDDTVGKAVEIINNSSVAVVSGLHTIPCRPKKRFVPSYLGYYVNSAPFHTQLHPYMQGIKVTSISKGNIGKTYISSPDLEEQQKITSLLNLLSSRIEKQRQLVEALKSYKRGALSKLFPKKGETTPEYRFAGFTEPWKQQKWCETVDMSKEMVDPRNGIYNSLPHVAPGNIESFTGRLFDNVKTVEQEELISGKFHFHAGDIIYCKINPQLGKYYFAKFEGLTSADAYVLNAKNGVIQEFLFAILQTKDFFDYSVSVSKRSGMPKINREELNAYLFLAPSELEQEQIGTFLMYLDHLISSQRSKIDEYERLKAGLLQQLFI